MRSSYSIKLLGPALLAAFVGIATLPAGAAPPSIAESTEVRYADLDLDNAAGIAELYARLQGAAEKVCDSRFHPGTLVVSASWRTCVADALTQAVAAVDRPAVTAYHASNASLPDAR
ncbi:MAG TPA: UrcA family protein, partial [Gammaproteobacteria bacterium]